MLKPTSLHGHLKCSIRIRHSAVMVKIGIRGERIHYVNDRTPQTRLQGCFTEQASISQSRFSENSESVHPEMRKTQFSV